jgi:hypothetical protein
LKKIGFIGAYDKTDLLIYIAKLLVENDVKVLIVDATTLQKTRYTVPCIMPSRKYITTYEDMDIAIGFENLQEIMNYAGTQEFNYDIMLLDIDNREAFENFEMYTSDKNYFVTAFDNYSIKKGLETVGQSEEKMLMTKILFSKNMDRDEDEYLNFLSFYYAVKWSKEKIYFPFEAGDSSVIVQNQRNARISFKELSMQYKEGILEIISQIAPEIRLGDVKKMLKNI